ncbi:hypothetical protein NLJ89_g1577 [Agrocybe chaxingu]|uniref:RRM domain-containing protein n=1 Tax=Agrocybe chaxingu TaxID=84603 RepID=A0A9W8TD48_9AGAR|nr:hypothetical protein NLJ89_g1577 [Agrocybe chaxingu]
MSKRLYLGRLPPDTRSEDVSKFFEGYGRIMDCRVMTGFGFVEFETAKVTGVSKFILQTSFLPLSQDAEDAVHTFNGKPFMGANIVIEFAKESRPRREYQEDRSYRHDCLSLNFDFPMLMPRRSGPRSRRPPGIRLIVSGVSRDTSWQDLKDFGRDAGSVSFADVDRDIPGQGVLEYLSREDADRAVKELDGKDLRGRPVRVSYDDSVCCLFSPVIKANWPSRSALVLITTAAMTVAVNGATIDTRMIATAMTDTAANALGRLPRRGEFDDRRPRSPAPRREYDDKRPAGYDDYRRGGYDDHRPPDYYYDRRRDDPERRRDDRRRDDKEDRYEDRAPRNGEAWAR